MITAREDGECGLVSRQYVTAVYASRREAMSRRSTLAEADIHAWCTDYIVNTLKLPAGRVEPNAKFARMGMDSAMAAEFLIALEEWLETELPPELVFEYPTIAELARYLLKHTNESVVG